MHSAGRQARFRQELKAKGYTTVTLIVPFAAAADFVTASQMTRVRADLTIGTLRDSKGKLVSIRSKSGREKPKLEMA